MAIFSINSVSTTGVVLASGDTLLISQNGALFTEAGDAVSGSGTISMSILGTLASGEGDAVDFTSGVEVDINVGATGYIGSNADAAIELDAQRFYLRNAGTIQASGNALTFGGAAAHSTCSISNSGTIQGQLDASFQTAFSNRFELVNSGRIEAIPYAITVVGADTTILQNSGVITASDVVAIRVYGGTTMIKNSGEILGAIDCTGERLVFANSGQVVGSVGGTNNADVFDLRAGVVTGSVFGEGGADLYKIDTATVTIVEEQESDLYFDTVEAWVSFTLPRFFEDLSLQGSMAVLGGGNAQDNRIYDSEVDNLLKGYRGNDLLAVFRGGADTLRGGSGNDTLNPEAGEDCLLIGGSGFDTVLLEQLEPAWVDLNLGVVRISDGRQHQISEVEQVRTGNGNDTLRGSIAAEEFRGNMGNDLIQSGGGIDSLRGGIGKDTLSGGTQVDAFVYGNSTFESRPGAEFRDIITDYQQGEFIVLNEMDAIAGGTNDPFVFIGTAAFTAAGQLRYEKIVAEGITLIEAEINGDGLVDFQIQINGLHDLAEGVFAL